MDKKLVSISSKRQITIPQKFFTALGFSNEAECVLRNGALIIRPIRNNSGGEFAENILSELISKGLSGEDLLCEFKKAQSKVRSGVEAMISASEDAANGIGEYSTYDEIFTAEE